MGKGQEEERNGKREGWEKKEISQMKGRESGKERAMETSFHSSFFKYPAPMCTILDKFGRNQKTFALAPTFKFRVPVCRVSVVYH